MHVGVGGFGVGGRPICWRELPHSDPDIDGSFGTEFSFSPDWTIFGADLDFSSDWGVIVSDPVFFFM